MDRMIGSSLRRSVKGRHDSQVAQREISFLQNVSQSRIARILLEQQTQGRISKDIEITSFFRDLEYTAKKTSLVQEDRGWNAHPLA